ncbi:hypothetical protein [Ruminococcus sp.]|uniref:hypothetical protein n=1 Tax=Ruminococcus sp. TaxID=41978 RepID=UPI001B450BB8|nr:hypothetical protein [Ruminococcus sp.]MBP5433684.1 hypothetical protein [Ruminococcus sp.]
MEYNDRFYRYVPEGNGISRKTVDTDGIGDWADSIDGVIAVLADGQKGMIDTISSMWKYIKDMTDAVSMLNSINKGLVDKVGELETEIKKLKGE